MAIRQTTIDDLDGSDVDVDTVYFSLGDDFYEIDLSPGHYDELADFLDTYIEHARTSSPRRAANGNGHVDTQAVRRWAASQQIELAPKGRIPASVVDAYQAANSNNATSPVPASI